MFEVTRQKGQAIGVVAGQFSFNRLLEKALNYGSWSDETKTHIGCGIDAIAITSYSVVI